ncbi:MAG TPA: DNA alkylation repair protein [Bacteroidia bacterium]|jgi:3-methyladenine DNA glycosylase AlkD|nr:DNA alkylation repair protein [Bacteroidia bacterium]
MSNNNKYLNHLQQSLINNASKLSAAQINAIADYMGTQHKIIGVGTQMQKDLAKTNYGLDIKEEDLFKLMDSAFTKSNVYEVKSAALLLVEFNLKKVDKKQLYKTMIPWVDHVDNWGHSDGLSKLYTRFLETEEFRDPFLKTLKNWNRDKNPWVRRQSMVALLYYSRTKNQHLPFKTIISLVSTQLQAQEYYVQKGLGWTLRESYNVYPVLTYKFVNDNFHKISPVAFTAAIEKMSDKEKTIIKQKRKAHRAKNK